MQFLDYYIGKQIRKPAGIFGSLLGNIMAANHQELTTWTLDQLQIQDHHCVLDIGCGSGLAIQMINNNFNHRYVVGIDYSSLMLRQASKQNKLAIRKSEIALCKGNVFSLPFINASFDKICAIETFYFWQNPLQALQEIKRVLKPGGTTAFAMEISKEGINKDKILNNAHRLGFPIYSGDEMKSLLSKAGFIHVNYKAIPTREKGWLCATGSIQDYH